MGDTPADQHMHVHTPAFMNSKAYFSPKGRKMGSYICQYKDNQPPKDGSNVYSWNVSLKYTLDSGQ
jgi:hypothetical protein